MTDDVGTPSRPLALLLTGGGARAAYQVGVLRYLAKLDPQLQIPIVTGVSAGGINAACLAASVDRFDECVENLCDLWLSLDPGSVFRVDSLSLGRGVLSWLLRLSSGGSELAPQTRGLVDTSPLRDFLEKALNSEQGVLGGISRNLESGRLKAVGLTTVEYATGRTVLWTQGAEVQGWQRPQRRSVETRFTVDHVMASAALPLLFPAIRLEHCWHGDGGVRLTSPLSPAIHMGARRILAISTRYRRTAEEAADPALEGYPPPAQIAGVLMNAIFLDLLDQDAVHLERTNRLLRHANDAGREDLAHVDLLVLRPSVDLGRLASDFEARLPRGFRFLTRGLGTRETKSSDLLSMLMFQRDYVERLIEIGEADAEAQREEISSLLAV